MAIFTIHQALQKPDYFDKVIKAKNLETPITFLLKRGEKPTNWEQKVEVEGLPVGYALQAAEGGDFDPSNIPNRMNLTLSQYLQKFRSRGYQVTKETKLLPGHTEAKGELQLARQQRKDAEELLLSIEYALGSVQEAVERGTTATTVAKTRGMMNWLHANTAHTVGVIPADLRPQNGIDRDFTATPLTEAAFRDTLLALAKEAGDGKLSLVGLCGSDFRKVMDDWTIKVSAVTGTDTILRRTEPRSRKIELIVDEFAYSGVSAKIFTCDNLGFNPTTAGAALVRGAVQFNSAAFIRPEFWSLDSLLPMTNYPLSDEGGGPRGFHDAICRLTCKNPLGQCRFLHVPTQSNQGT